MGSHTSIKSSRTKFESIDWKLREKSKVLNFKGLKFQINLIDINKFKIHNSSISVNVFGCEKLVYPFRISEYNYKRESTVNLLLISNDTKQHYYWMKDISKLLSLQTSKHGYDKHVCFRCINTEKSLASNHDYCKSYEAINIELPKEGSKISFKNRNRSMLIPFILYADFESFTPQLSTCQPNPEKSYTKQHQKHIPSGFCHYIKYFKDTLFLNSQLLL